MWGFGDICGICTEKRTLGASVGSKDVCIYFCDDGDYYRKQMSGFPVCLLDMVFQSIICSLVIRFPFISWKFL